MAGDLDESMKILSIGCPNFKKFHLVCVMLTTQGINYLINNSSQLQELRLQGSLICNDGLIIPTS